MLYNHFQSVVLLLVLVFRSHKYLVLSQGQGLESLCEPTYYGSTTCSLCNTTSFCTYGGCKECHSCGNSTYANRTGAYICTSNQTTKCPPGSGSGGSVQGCYNCLNGYYNDGSHLSCKECPLNGDFRSNSYGAYSCTSRYTPMLPCPPGSEIITGYTGCFPCSLNNYNLGNSSSCSPCKPGSHSLGFGAYGCSDDMITLSRCPAGSGKKDGVGAGCFACDPDTFNDGTRMECSPCAPGMSASGAYGAYSCTSALTNFTKSSCPPGSAPLNSEANPTGCFACSPFSFSPGGLDSCLFCSTAKSYGSTTCTTPPTASPVSIPKSDILSFSTNFILRGVSVISLSNNSKEAILNTVSIGLNIDRSFLSMTYSENTAAAGKGGRIIFTNSYSNPISKVKAEENKYDGHGEERFRTVTYIAIPLIGKYAKDPYSYYVLLSNNLLSNFRGGYLTTSLQAQSFMLGSIELSNVTVINATNSAYSIISTPTISPTAAPTNAVSTTRSIQLTYVYITVALLLGVSFVLGLGRLSCLVYNKYMRLDTDEPPEGVALDPEAARIACATLPLAYACRLEEGVDNDSILADAACAIEIQDEDPEGDGATTQAMLIDAGVLAGEGFDNADVAAAGGGSRSNHISNARAEEIDDDDGVNDAVESQQFLQETENRQRNAREDRSSFNSDEVNEEEYRDDIPDLTSTASMSTSVDLESPRFDLNK